MSDKNIFQKTQLIELRQQNNNSKNSNVDKDANGDYRVTLNKPVLIEEGDAVGLHSVFLDTAATNDGLILLEPTNDGVVPPKETKISATFGYYLTNMPTSNETPFNTSGADIISKQYTNTAAGPTENTGERIDGEIYVACDRHIISVGAGFVCSGFSLKMTAPALNNPDPTKYLNLAIVISYKADASGKTLQAGVNINLPVLGNFPKIRARMVTADGNLQIDSELQKLISNTTGAEKAFQFLNLPFHFDGNTQPTITTFNGNGRSENHDYPIQGVSLITEDQSRTSVAAETRHPILNTISFNVPSGKYTASQICSLIGQNFTNLNLMGNIGTETYDIANNPLLTTSANLIKQTRTEKGSADTTHDTIEFIRTDGTKSFQLKTRLEADNSLTPGTPNYLIGSSQFSLLFNDVSSKVELHSIHDSFLSLEANSGGQPQVRAYKNTGGDKFVANKYSGIFLTDLEPKSLWTDQFKFNQALGSQGLLLDIHNANTLTIEGQIINVPTFLSTNPTPNALLDGINITGDDMGLDSLVTKQSSGPTAAAPAVFNKAYDLPSAFVDYPNFNATNTQDNIGILADGIVNSGGIGGSEAEGYYQIEIDFGIDQDIQGKDALNNKIQGIVSRYYSQGSYTSAYSEGQIPYIHKGAPLYVNEYRVRILQPDNSLATDIQNNNTIFLQITKSK